MNSFAVKNCIDFLNETHLIIIEIAFSLFVQTYHKNYCYLFLFDDIEHFLCQMELIVRKHCTCKYVYENQ